MQFTKEQLIAKAREQITFCRHTKITGEGRTHVNQCLALFEIALASLEAEKAILYRERTPYNGLTTGWQELTDDEYEFIKDNAGENAEFRTVYTAPPAPVLNKEPLLEFAKEYIESWELGMAGDSGLLESAKRAIADSAIQQPAPFVLPVQHWEELCRQNPDMSIGDAIIRASWWNHCAAMLNGEKS
ncbi:hypothetical protein [Enterobacter ludwigii]|uniref:hypothetical protein n=1 Tax=Enterobacter ludwigii TaxID=299767 RepID=UPI001867E1A2|nr:hypothetical protein [Enterobacter ludwigii]